MGLKVLEWVMLCEDDSNCLLDDISGALLSCSVCLVLAKILSQMTISSNSTNDKLGSRFWQAMFLRVANLDPHSFTCSKETLI